MAHLAAPDPDDLGHDTGQVGVHYAPVERRIWTLGDEVEHTDAEFPHSHSSNNGNARQVCTRRDRPAPRGKPDGQKAGNPFKIPCLHPLCKDAVFPRPRPGSGTTTRTTALTSR